MRAILIFAGCSAILTSAACGGSITTVDGNANTGSLQPTQKQQLCSDVYTYVTNNFSVSDFAALTCGAEASSQKNCQQAYSSCLAKSPSAGGIPVPTAPTKSDCAAFEQAVVLCHSTVAEFSNCVEEALNAVKILESQEPLCTTADYEAAGLMAVQSLSSDCVSLFTSCESALVPGTGSSVNVGGSSKLDGGAG
jgi:hypothetical protein